MFEHYRTFTYNLAGRDLTIETGKMAQLSNGSCLVRYGDTVIPRQRDGLRRAARRYRLSAPVRRF